MLLKFQWWNLLQIFIACNCFSVPPLLATVYLNASLALHQCSLCNVGWSGKGIVTYPVKAVNMDTLPASIGGSHDLRNENNSDRWTMSATGQSALDIAPAGH